MARHELEGLRAAEEAWTAHGPCIGWLAAESRPGALRVDFRGNARGPLPARSLIAWTADQITAAVASRRELLVLFEESDPRRPVIVGPLEDASPTPLLDEVLAAPAPAEASRSEAIVDGKRVVLEGETEVVLRCGESSITLRPNGHVTIRGVYIDSHAEGVNRIKGGAVKIN